MSDWRNDLEEKIRLEVVENVQHWRESAYLLITDYNDAQAPEIEFRIPDYDDGFCDDDMIRPRATLADLLRDWIRVTGPWLDGPQDDAVLLAGTIESHHVDEQLKLKLAQDLLRLVLAYEAIPKEA